MISDIKLSIVYNSRGERTVKVSVSTDKGVFSSCAPSGKSVGKHEAVYMEPKKISRFFNKFKTNFIGLREQDFEIIDNMLEQFGGADFRKIGGNLAIAFSQAVCKAAALGDAYKIFNEYPKYFPFPLGNLIGGGVHGGGTDIQEFLVLPLKAKTMQEAVETNINIWHYAEKMLKKTGVFIGKNDEGAIITDMNDIKTLDFVSDIAEQFDAKIGLDFAATQFYKRDIYRYKKLGREFATEEHIDFVLDIIKKYKIVYAEDPFMENDFESFSELRKKARCIVCGDDLFATKLNRLEKGRKKSAGNAIIIKPNQTGTVSRVLETVELAKKSGFMHVVSHRSGETCDPFIADLAVGTEAKIIKCGIMGSERLAKANRLLEIWNSVSEKRKAEMAIIKI